MHSHTRTSHFGLVSLPLVLALLTFASPNQCQSAEASPQAQQLTAEQQEKLKERDRHGEEASKLRREGKLEEAIAAAEKMLAIEREVYGDVHEDVAGSLELLAEMHEEGEAWDAARRERQEVLEIKTTLFGKDHYRVTDARLTLANLERLADWSPEERRRLSEAEQLNGQVLILYREGKHKSAIPLARQEMETRKDLLGEEHPDYARSLNNLASLYDSMGEYAKAKPLYVESAEILKRVLGEEHPSCAKSLINLANFYESRGEYMKAEPLFVQARKIFKRVHGEEHPDYAASLVCLAFLYKSMGDYTKAEPLLVQATEILKRVQGGKHLTYAASVNNLADLYYKMGDYTKAEPLLVQFHEILKQVLGEDHPNYALSLNNLAELYRTMGDYAKAEPLFVQTREIIKRIQGEEHLFYAASLNNLAGLYQSMDDYTKAEQLYVQALEIFKRVQGEVHPDYAGRLLNLAELYRTMGDYAKAEPLLVQARKIFKRVQGEDHPDYARSVNNLARLYYSAGQYAKAEPLFVQAIEIRKRVLGEEHPDYAASLNDLAFFFHSSGEDAKAEPLFRKALGIKLNLAWNTSLWLPESQAMSFIRKNRPGRDPLLSVLRRLPGVDDQEAYSVVWNTRALITRTVSHRRHSLFESPEAQQLYKQLRCVGQQLAQLTLAVPKLDGRELRRKRLAELNEEKEILERDLSKLSIDHRRSTQIAEADVADLTRLLPKAVAVVDFLRATVGSPSAEGKGEMESEAHYEAFVVHSKEQEECQSVEWVHLGPAKPIEDAVAQWRQAIGREDGRGLGGYRPLPFTSGGQAQQASARQRLREVIWEKLELHLNGIQTVVIIPDGALTRLPWAALPGRKPNTYLLEDYAVAIAENGQQLYARLTDRDSSGDGLLLVGGVSYDKSPTAPTAPETLLASADGVMTERTRGPALEERPSWDYLAGSEQELAGVRDLWPSTGKVVLQGTSANETSLRQFMPQSRYIHLATHGFFADEKFRSMFGHDVAGEQLFGGGTDFVSAPRAGVTVRNPLILSGIVLAGANLPPKTDELGLPTGEDGILTAEEVVNLDLRNTELVVLSACDTGLGKVAGGEGVFGLQRAFGLAGVRTTIASLWKVDDDATRALMVEFYRNLWEKKLGKLESLRQAQLTMLRQYDPVAKRLRGPGPVKPVDPQQLEESKGKPREPLPPLYWAGFVLGGDWR